MAGAEHAEVLRQGVGVWNAWRDANPSVQPNLAETDFRSADLRGANFAGAVLMGAKFTDAKLSGANLQAAMLLAADLMGADLTGADLWRAKLFECNLRSAVLRDAVLKRANGSRIILADGDLTGANLSEAYLPDGDLQRAVLDEADLTEVRLCGADLREASFFKARLRRTDFSRARLEGVDFSAKFSQADFAGEAIFDQAQMQGGKLWEAHLYGASFRKANLQTAYLGGAFLRTADLSEADLRGAFLDKAHLEYANLAGACLEGANLSGAFLRGSDLRHADLRGANLEGAQLIATEVDETVLSDSHIYGIAVWDLKGTPREQKGLRVTSGDGATITTDSLEVAQFIHLLLRRDKLRNVIDSITSKAVLIIGRFTPERKVILDGLAAELRRHNLLPIIFDFDRSTSRDVTETIKTLAGLSFFVIADITNPKSAPLELQATVPDYQIPFVPIIEHGEAPFAMFVDLANKYDWVLDTVTYRSLDTLRRSFQAGVLERVWKKRRELDAKKAEVLKMTPIESFLNNDR